MANSLGLCRTLSKSCAKLRKPLFFGHLRKRRFGGNDKRQPSVAESWDYSPTRGASDRAAVLQSAPVSPAAPLGPFEGTACAFLGALALLAALSRATRARCCRCCSSTSPKSLRLLAVAQPLWAPAAPFDSTMTAFVQAMAVGVALDLLVTDWRHVSARYVRRPGEAWTMAEAVSAERG